MFNLSTYWIGAAGAQLSYKQQVTGSNPVSSTLINVLSTKRENAKTADATLAKFMERSGGYLAISFIQNIGLVGKKRLYKHLIYYIYSRRLVGKALH